MPDQPRNSERLASLEAKVEILLDLLKEIRDELKSHPTREEYSALIKRVDSLEAQNNQLEESYKRLMWKVAAFSGGLLVLIELISSYLRLK